MSAADVKRMVDEATRRGDLPAGVTQSTLRKMSESLTRYFDTASKAKIAEWAQAAKEAVESAFSEEEGGNLATARAGLTSFMEASGAEDIADTMDLDFFLRIPMEVAQGAAQHLARNLDQDRVEAYPALELKRVYPRIVPRGSEKDPAGPENGWDDDDGRWVAACEEAGDDDAARVFEDTGRMVALKDSEVWGALGDGAGGYEDGLGNDFPPFAFNSGMDCDEVSYGQCVALGLLDDGDEVEGADIDPEDLIEMDARRMVLAALQAADWSEELHPRGAHGKFVGKGDDTGTVEAAFPPIHGKSVMTVVRRMAREGFTKEEIRKVMNSYGIPMSDTSIKMAFGKFEQAKEVAELTPEQMKDLRDRSTSTAPEPPKPPKIEKPERPAAPVPTPRPAAPEPPKRDPNALEPRPEKGSAREHDMESVFKAGVSHEDAARIIASRARYHDASAEDVKKFEASISNGARIYTPEALARMVENTSKIRYAPYGEEYSRQYGTGQGASIAFFRHADKLIVQSEVGGTEANAPGNRTMAHEMAHAIDRTATDPGKPYAYGRQWNYTDTEAWHRAWKADMKDRNLRDYAWTNVREGFAVSCEHVYERGYDSLRQRAPRMAKLLKDWNIVKT